MALFPVGIFDKLGALTTLCAHCGGARVELLFDSGQAPLIHRAQTSAQFLRCNDMACRTVRPPPRANEFVRGMAPKWLLKWNETGDCSLLAFLLMCRTLNHNSIGSFPAGIFDSLTALTYLYGRRRRAKAVHTLTVPRVRRDISQNGLRDSAIPAGLFDKLTALTQLCVCQLAS